MVHFFYMEGAIQVNLDIILFDLNKMETHVAEAFLILDIQGPPAVNAPLPVLITVRPL